MSMTDSLSETLLVPGSSATDTDATEANPLYLDEPAGPPPSAVSHRVAYEAPRSQEQVDDQVAPRQLERQRIYLSRANYA